ncbi:adenosylmethionine--8-amino-7-oxononanoate transaminase [Salinibius halmophilus]|uniref:adenosylmethionine--8-amino-7-oxononanoate transaminase n=1 Tax=Salinibius halmophilus TaxID=1853216 RepID=UPI000E65F972|nr:adenosylmethionine--8-amino-7-oxononanoate transaminase [Salinibius halmophilus]
MNSNQVKQIDAEHLWHPYAAMGSASQYVVTHAKGAKITIANHGEVLDGMASWWACIHGYNHPLLNQALHQQVESFSHVMFGGLTHAPAAELAEQLMQHLPAGLTRFFFTDSGSVSIEVALKLVLQYQMAKRRPKRRKMASLRGAYHGDTFGAMSLCDPDKSMHSMFNSMLAQHCFLPRPTAEFSEDIWQQWQQTLLAQQDEIAGVFVEPLLQGAGGMQPYHSEYLRRLRALCNELDILLVADEIATGFGRTGQWFACQTAGIVPDVICIGKALTGGYMTMAAMVTTSKVAQQMSASPAGVLMHGPTFMANPLACKVAGASIRLLESYPWQARVSTMNARYQAALSTIEAIAGVSQVRTLGNIIAVDLTAPVDMASFTKLAVSHGIWLRPFGNMVYMMPPYLLNDSEQALLVERFIRVLQQYQQTR